MHGDLTGLVGVGEDLLRLPSLIVLHREVNSVIDLHWNLFFKTLHLNLCT
jgi:hypothetical protein